ncbi:Lrp/AsnC family transcriptional regulator [Streptomyces sp. RKAG337]|uniref:Lrp/AsnC family transcriptional regulator n=1 Tax=Streptomyces sp. RKAG337 TaxID=2893404 RepID=UPI00203320C8|nr:winged helix-turn-helix transcriptional regulator [Streptomyces sp. RKAG337]MCM2429713.1 winged helix-turn-helix transcriptional regulator [Streptomyces sp. RKAG337]
MKNGRISNADLAAQVGPSPSPCVRRVNRLEASGVNCGYRADIAPPHSTEAGASSSASASCATPAPTSPL